MVYRREMGKVAQPNDSRNALHKTECSEFGQRREGEPDTVARLYEKHRYCRLDANERSCNKEAFVFLADHITCV